VSPLEAEAVESRIAGFEKAGVPHDIAEDVAVLPVLNAVPEIILLSHAQHVPAESAARVYFDTGALLGFDRLRALANRIVASDHWDRLALRRIVDDLYAAQRLLACDALTHRPEASADPIESWAKRRHAEVERTLAFLAELERGGEASIAKLALANSQIQKLAASGSP
jgi:glutamate dehydrogenase